ncbi:hypothetical protein U1Q18_012678 [Sarracenia purpurea var. burkii]
MPPLPLRWKPPATTPSAPKKSPETTALFFYSASDLQSKKTTAPPLPKRHCWSFCTAAVLHCCACNSNGGIPLCCAPTLIFRCFFLASSPLTVAAPFFNLWTLPIHRPSPLQLFSAAAYAAGIPLRAGDEQSSESLVGTVIHRPCAEPSWTEILID